jgi:hypothetical protein
MSDSIFLRTSSLLGPYDHNSDITKHSNGPTMSVVKIISWFNSDAFNLHLVLTNLQVETANEVRDIIIIAKDLQHRAGDINNMHTIY